MTITHITTLIIFLVDHAPHAMITYLVHGFPKNLVPQKFQTTYMCMVIVDTNVHLSISIQGIHDQINGLDDFVSVSWNGVNMKPAKQE